MKRLPIICKNGIGDSFLVLGRVPIAFLGNIGFRFNIFYSSTQHPAQKIIIPFFHEIRYCNFVEREPSASEKWIFTKLMSLSMRSDKIWCPPFGLPPRQKSKGSGKRILLHTHLDGHHGWKGASAKMWPIENWVELCRKLHAEEWEVAILEWDEGAIHELQNECPFLKDGRRERLLDMVKSFGEYDFLFSIDSWSKYVAVWAELKQVVALSDLSSGYTGFETISPKQVARWWFHGVLNHPKVRVLGLEERQGVYSYKYSQISEMSVENAIDAIREVVGNEIANE